MSSDLILVLTFLEYVEHWLFSGCKLTRGDTMETNPWRDTTLYIIVFAENNQIKVKALSYQTLVGVQLAPVFFFFRIRVCLFVCFH